MHACTCTHARAHTHVYTNTLTHARMQVSIEIAEGAATMQARYRAIWELERVLYQRFRYTETGILSQDIDFDVLQV